MAKLSIIEEIQKHLDLLNEFGPLTAPQGGSVDTKEKDKKGICDMHIELHKKRPSCRGFREVESKA